MLDKTLVAQIFQQLTAHPVYTAYIGEESREKSKEREIIKIIFSELMLPNDLFISHIEEYFNNWDDDAEMMEQLVLTFIQKPKSIKFNEIMSPDKWEFARTLLKTAIEKKDYCAELIKPKLKNWDAERIAQLDMVLMRMGLCELLYFDFTCVYAIKTEGRVALKENRLTFFVGVHNFVSADFGKSEIFQFTEDPFIF